MKTLSSPRTVPASLTHAALAVVLGLGLTFVVAQLSIPSISAAVLALFFLLFFLFFLNRPDLGLLITLLVRSSTDLSFWILGGALVSNRIGALPNVGLILILILAGSLFILSRGVPLLRLPGGILLALLLLTGLVGILRSPSALLSFNEWLPVVSGFIVYALAAHLFRSPRQVQAVIGVLGASFVVPAVIGFYQLATRTGLMDVFVGRRVSGSFVHPNAFGVYMVLIFSVFLCQALVQSGRRKFAALLIVGASVALLAGTLTRVAWVGAVVVLITVGVLRSRALLVIATLLIVIAVSTVSSIGARLADPFGGSFADRVDLWRSVLGEWVYVTGRDMSSIPIALNRLAGMGPGIVGALSSTGRWGIPYAAHNDYLRVFVEYGLFGLGLFLALHLVLLVFAFRTWKQSTDDAMSAVALSFVALAVAYPVMSITENIFAATHNQIYFWTVAGLTVAVSRLSASTTSRPTLPIE